ncbi:MAG: hypothetical protein QM628_17315 [Propionicimonas sp.]
MSTPTNIRLTSHRLIDHVIYDTHEAVEAALAYDFDPCDIGEVESATYVRIERDALHPDRPLSVFVSSHDRSGGDFLDALPDWLPPLPEGWDQVALDYAARLKAPSPDDQREDELRAGFEAGVEALADRIEGVRA